MPAPLTTAIIDQVREYAVDTLPPDVVTAAKHCLLDWLGCAVAGSGEPIAEILRAQADADGGRRECSIMGQPGKVNTTQACLINGAASHSQDYDDVLEIMLGHPSVTVAPVAFALGERDRRSGADVLAAFVAGVQVEASVGALVEPQHHERGWHTTATLGTFGATAAACRLLGLDRDAWNRAFGLAATQAGGLKSMFGTMGKPFHAGKAAAQGYVAASLAARGMTSAPNVLEIPRGFLDVTTPGAPGGRTSLPPKDFAVRQVLFKAHAACYLTHSTIEGVLELARTHKFSVADIESIEVEVLPVHRTTCAISAPETGLEAKFSIAHAAAIALVEGKAGEAQFTDGIVHRPGIRELAGRVVLREGESQRSQMVTPVRITLCDGRRLDAVVDTGAPARGAGIARQWDRLVAKFMDLTTPVLGASAAGRIVALVEKLEQLSTLDELTGMVGGGLLDARFR
ncbi:MmgE/PrpD family protein [Amycolatopsis panacis]|nr:MmgE/PrpD family protein [Amycolatopsis panacis]